MAASDRLLDKLQVSALIPERKLLSLPFTATVEETVEFLLKHRLQAIPIIDPKSKELGGFVDTIDIISYMLAQQPDQLEEVQKSFLAALEHARKAFAEETVSDLLITLKRSAGGAAVSATAPARKLIDFFARANPHRLVVEDASTNAINIISQSDVIHFIAGHIHLFGPALQEQLDKAGAVITRVFTEQKTRTVLDVLRTLHLNSISAVAIVDENQTVIANFSVSDLKGIARKDYQRLLLNVMEFLSTKLQAEKPFLAADASALDQSLHPVTCKATDTLEYAILKLTATKTHRLWVVDDNGKAAGVVAMVDILKAIARSC